MEEEGGFAGGGDLAVMLAEEILQGCGRIVEELEGADFAVGIFVGIGDLVRVGGVGYEAEFGMRGEDVVGEAGADEGIGAESEAGFLVDFAGDGFEGIEPGGAEIFVAVSVATDDVVAARVDVSAGSFFDENFCVGGAHHGADREGICEFIAGVSARVGWRAGAYVFLVAGVAEI